jgi:DNA segregation ATPase FtsK/SpoIIIE-like protein
MEFVFYDGLPHLYVDTPGDVAGSPVWDTEYPITNGIVQELKDVMPTMERLREIMDSRLTRIKNAGFKDFNGYNRGITIKSRRLPALVIVFDEWAKIRLNRKIGTEAETLLAELTNLARAAGMYFIVGTQNPNKEVLSALISVNFSTRVVFKCSIGGSLAALGTQSAHNLEVKGRAILLDGGEEIKLQTARISDSLIRAMVYKAITGKDMKSSETDLEEIMQYALDYLDGYLDSTKLFEIFRTKRVRQAWLIRALREAEGQEFVLSGTPYRVSKRGSKTPRRLERLDV